jgi:TonB-dependent receptor
MKRNYGHRSTLWARPSQLAIGSVLAALVPLQALAQDAGAPTRTDPASGEAVTEIDEVVVLGLRRSLDTAVSIKRNADQIVDAITAEDLGAFSDNNIGEALERVPGVQLERNEGEGFRISIRGLGPRFVQTTINGRTALSSPGGEGGTDARGFAFDILPSEVITGATVAKSTQAVDIEGGIGGAVDLQTVRPLDFAERRGRPRREGDFFASGASRTTYNDFGEDAGHRMSVFLNNKFSDSFGAFFSVVSDESSRLQDSSETQAFDVRGFTLLPGTILNGETLTASRRIERGAMFDGVRNIRRDRSRQRETYVGGLQWRPSDQFEVNFDWTHGKSAEDRLEMRSWLRVADALERLDNSRSPTVIRSLTLVTGDADQFSDGTITQFEFRNYTERTARQYVDVASLLVDDDQTIDIGGIELEWDNGGPLTISANVGYAGHERIFLQRRVQGDLDWSNQNDPARFPIWNGQSATRATSGVNGSFDITSGVPIVQYVDVNGVPYDVNSLSDINFDQDRQTYVVEDSRELSYRLDFAYDVGGWVDEIKFGASLREFEGFRTELRSEGNAGSSNTGPLMDIGLEQYGVLTVNNFMNRITTPGFGHSFVVPDINAWIAADPAGTFAGDPRDGIQRQDIEYDIGEEILGGYVQAGFSSDGAIPYRGNFGVRYVRTQQTSAGQLGVQNNADFVPLDPNNPFVVTRRAYSDILPSANVALDLTDSTILRFAASRTVTRPDPVDLRQGFDLDRIDGTDNEGFSGNPDLDPYRANNFDVSLEWYPEGGGAYGIGVFHKELDGFIADGTQLVDIDLSPVNPALGLTTFELERPVNTEGGTITGVEASLFTPFDSFTDGFFRHFGVQSSITYVDASLDAVRGSGQPVELRGTSSWSGNFVGYYDDGDLSIRLAYNWRNDFLHQEAPSAIEFDEFTKGTEVLNLNVNYRLNEHWQIRFSANNLLDAQQERVWRANANEYFSDYREDGKSFVFELRARL